VLVVVLLGVLASFAEACTSYRDGPFVPVKGRFFDYRLVAEIQDHQTTEEQLVEWLGLPLEAEAAPDGTKTLRYFVVRERESVERSLSSKRTYVLTVTHELVVAVSAGVITSHHYSTESEDSVEPPA
jgi:hypothetical protein